MRGDAEKNYRLKHIRVLLAWCLPVGLAYLGYICGINKLIFLNTIGATIYNVNDKTEDAIRLVVWIHEHQWVFLLALALIIVIFVIPKDRKTLAIIRLGMLVLISLACLRSCELGTYLNGKVITFPEKPAEATTTPGQAEGR